MKSFIEKYSTFIGIGLIVLSLIGGTLLMVKKRAGASGDRLSNEERNHQEIEELKNKITSLEQQIEALKLAPVASVPEVVASPSPTTKSSQSTGKININTASQAQLESLPGIGPVYAGRIIEQRNTSGGFKSIDQIQSVKGIGPKTYNKFKDLITI